MGEVDEAFSLGSAFEATQERFPGFPWWLGGKESACQFRRRRFSLRSGKIPAKRVCHDHWACALETGTHHCWAHVLHPLKPVSPRACAPQQWEACTLQLQSSPLLTMLEKGDPAQPKINKQNYIYKWVIEKHTEDLWVFKKRKDSQHLLQDLERSKLATEVDHMNLWWLSEWMQQRNSS